MGISERVTDRLRMVKRIGGNSVTSNKHECFLFSREMLEQGGYSYQVDLWPLADRVGVTNIWEALRDVAHAAMEEWARRDSAAGVDRIYSVWAGTLEGLSGIGSITHIGLVYVVEHEGPSLDPDTYDGAPSPFDEQFPQMPEFVRIEAGAPIFDGARPWYLVRGDDVISADPDDEGHRALVDDVLSDCWQGQMMLEAVGGEHFYVESDGPQAVRCAKGYLRRYLRDRRVYNMADLPGGQAGEVAPQWLQDYFDSGGLMFHTTDWRNDDSTILFALTDVPDLLRNAPLHWGLDFDLDADWLAHHVVFEDPTEGDLALEFIYDLSSVSHVEQLASVATQDTVGLHVYERRDDGAAVLSASRSMQASEDEVNHFALIIAQIIDLVDQGGSAGDARDR